MGPRSRNLCTGQKPKVCESPTGESQRAARHWTSASSAIHELDPSSLLWNTHSMSDSDEGPRHFHRKVDVIIKLGGAAITKKDELETIDDEVLDACVSIIAKQREKGNPNIVVVHGAGSFGHFSAKKYGVADGGILEGTGAAASERLRKGVAETRASVGKLNSIVTSRLVAAGVPAVSLPTFGHWFTYDRGRQRAVRESAPGLRAVTCSIDSGFVPVLHGDVSLDMEQDCAILSGDTIVRELCEFLKPKRAVFITDVPGVFDRAPPPRKDRAAADPPLALLTDVWVERSAAWAVQKAEVGLEEHADGSVTRDENAATTPDASSARKRACDISSDNTGAVLGVKKSHDVTGGVAGKFHEAVRIVNKASIDVFITNHHESTGGAAVWGLVDTYAYVDHERLTWSETEGDAATAKPWFGTLLHPW